MDASHEPVVISVRDLVVGFGDRIVLDHLSLDVRRGEILGLVGASGSGKSVLTRTILGLIPKRAGTIALFGKNTDELSPEERRRSYGRLRKQEENCLYQDNVDKNDRQRGDDYAVRGSAPNALSALIGGVAEVRGNQANNGSKNSCLEGGGNKGRPAHVMERAGQIEL